jgi:hypothetical protein
MHHFMNRRWGLIRLVRELHMPTLREAYEDTRAAAADVDLLVSHPLGYVTRLVAETTGIAWASTMLAPVGFFSVYDQPLMPPLPHLSRWLRFLGPPAWKPL